jgi:prolyl-tRNA editing enzyme YbaK/EbsC (Cys-tRNA(Pro) deacylase)
MALPISPANERLESRKLEIRRHFKSLIMTARLYIQVVISIFRGACNAVCNLDRPPVYVDLGQALA